MGYQTSKKVLIIIPAYNEAKNLVPLIQGIREGIRWEDILVINDGSDDETKAISESMSVDVLNLPYNLGIGGAVQAGYKFALEMGYDVVIRLDGDGQHPPTEANKLSIPVLKGEADMTIGSRYKGEGDYAPQRLRKLGTKVFSILVSLMIKQRITDATSGFAAMNRDVIKILCREFPRDYPEVESLVILHKYKMRIAEIPVKMKKRGDGRSSINGWKQVYYMIKVLLSLLIRLGEEKKMWEEK